MLNTHRRNSQLCLIRTRLVCYLYDVQYWWNSHTFPNHMQQRAIDFYHRARNCWTCHWSWDLSWMSSLIGADKSSFQESESNHDVWNVFYCFHSFVNPHQVSKGIGHFTILHCCEKYEGFYTSLFSRFLTRLWSGPLITSFLAKNVWITHNSTTCEGVLMSFVVLRF